ncbi:MAG: hypothetical protein Q9165_003988 [Trypethelium subeluteriae]
MALSRFEGCPNEILSGIFMALPDFQALRTLALTGPVFYHVLIRDSPRIVGSVVANEVPVELLPEAVAVLRTSLRDQTDCLTLRKFLGQYLTSRQSSLEREWTIRDGASIHKIHDICTVFAGKFASEALSNCHLANDWFEEKPERPASERELLRIVRSFYRFELYLNLFSSNSLLHRANAKESHFVYLRYAEERRQYWRQYAPWENEQLACIHDWLCRSIAVPYHEMLMHDIGWAKTTRLTHLNLMYRHHEPEREHILAQGLGFLKQLFDATSYGEWRKILSFREEIPGLPSVMRQISGESPSTLTGFYDDNDNGPEKSWGLAHCNNRNCCPCYFYAEKDYDLRARGYCFWDRERIETWGVSTESGIRDIVRERDVFTDEIEHYLSVREATQTWGIRKEIWDQGGRGWWSKDDESKIEWPSKKPEKSPK